MVRRSFNFAPLSACTRQGCTLPPDGARPARSRMSRMVFSGTGFGRNARQEYREATASRTSILEMLHGVRPQAFAACNGRRSAVNRARPYGRESHTKVV